MCRKSLKESQLNMKTNVERERRYTARWYAQKAARADKRLAASERRPLLLAKINAVRAAMGLSLLRLHDKLVSNDGVCVRCGVEQVLDSAGIPRCRYCQEGRHDLIETEREALMRMDAMRMEYKSEIRVKIGCALHNLQ